MKAVFDAGGQVGLDAFGNGDVVAVALAGNTTLKDFSMLRECSELVYFDARESNFYDLSILNSDSMRRLALGATPIQDLEPLRNRFPNLQMLNLRNTEVTDISPVATLTNLTALDISLTSVSDFSPLKECINLRQLHVSDTVSDEAIADLRRALPNCRISKWGSGRSKWIAKSGWGVEYFGWIRR